jgi:hypothetical protein
VETLHVALDVHNRREEMFEPAADADPAADHGKHCENHERDEHRVRRFVDVMLHLMIHARFPVEREEQQPEHVEGSHARGEPADEPEEMAVAEGMPKNFIFAEKTGERRDSGDRKGGGEHGEIRLADFPGERAHFLHVLLAGERVDDAAGGEEQQAFEKCVGHQMENSGGKRTDTESEEHVSELRDG